MDKMSAPTAFVQQLHRHARKLQQVIPTEKLANMAMAFLMLSAGLVLVNGTPPPPKPTPGSDLSFNYYDSLCTNHSAWTPATWMFQNLTASIVGPKIAADPGLVSALIRLAFHDCFVRGCDASVLLNTTDGNGPVEKEALANLSLRGFEVIDAVKAALEQVCPGVFSCADILQEVARAAQLFLNQTSFKPFWALRYGRRDGRVSLAAEIGDNLPAPNMSYTQLVANFAAQGLNAVDLITLSGAHTYGIAHCISIFQRLYNVSGNNDTDPTLDPTYAASLKSQCPRNGNPLNVVNLDVTTPSTFDNVYYQNIYIGRDLFTSDHELKNQSLTASFANSNAQFLGNFSVSMTKMTEIKVKLYPNGEIRSQCAFPN